MFKLVVLSALFALAAAKPGYLHGVHGVAPLAYSSPVVVSAHVPAVAVVKSVPSAVSHSYRTDVHSKPAVVAVAPAVTYVKQVSPISYSVPVVSHELVGAHGLGYAGHSGLIGTHGLGYASHSGLW